MSYKVLILLKLLHKNSRSILFQTVLYSLIYFSYNEYGICVPDFFYNWYWDSLLPEPYYTRDLQCDKQDYLLMWCRILSNSRKSLISLRKNNDFKSHVDSAMLAMV